ncbi:hypothetical protein FACS189435_2260 [Bacteroidia bacterium]|nr:hypothetical protein FACS189435_2260 [Bacteroidia bacterium]
MKCIAMIVFCLAACIVQAQEADGNATSRSYKATRTEVPPVIDGWLADDCWTAGGWSGTFIQQRPNEGSPETEDTHLKILYDDRFVYVAFQAFDAEPDKINRWLSPRDNLNGDAVAVVFDSYNDKRTGFAFALTAGGTKADFLCSNSDNDDYTWNAVWEGKTAIDEKGWYAEFRIPLSQLRYAASEGEQEWGFTAVRVIDRKKEQSFIHLVPQINNGFIYSFSRLEGISNLPKSRRIELTPYTTLKYQLSSKEEGNPYATGSEWNFGAGMDGKVGLSSDFTLDFTINPDFGQVEADPSTINLSAFETYYEEKRPFFLEGKNIFGSMGESMFYSRRIGSRPRWEPDEQDGRYAYVPKETTILSAIKVSGKSKDGLSVGVVNSLTAIEKARITENGSEYRMTAQPFTSYSVGRVQKDFKKGNTVLGGMLTSVNRSLGEEHLKGLVKNAYAGAIDFEQYFRNREYYVKGIVQYSYAEGTREAITDLQRSPVHFYQREGVTHLGVDSSRTNLQGNSGRILIGRGGTNNKFFTEHNYFWATPGFEVNDVGYIEQADYKMLRGYAGYRETKPKGIFRNYTVDAFYRYLWDFGNTYTFGRAGGEMNLNFTSKHYLYFCLFYDPRTIETAMLRGGPPVMVNPRWGTDFVFETDNSKKVSGIVYHGTVLGSQRYAQFAYVQGNYRPIPNLNLSARLTYSHWNKGLEYAAAPTLDNGDKAYIMSAMRQETLYLTMRMDYSITPDLSIQFYGNPFLSSGKYTDFKRATNTMDKDYNNRFRPLGTGQISYNAQDNSYTADEANGDKYTFDNPDFSFREFRFNVVTRWEYRPNSILYLVWGQERSGRANEFVPSFTQNTNALFGYHPGNVFMIKLNYWFTI